MEITKEKAEAVKHMRGSEGWKVIEEDLKEKMEDVKEGLFSFSTSDILDGKHKYLPIYSLFDLKAYELAIYQGLLDLPEELMSSLVSNIATEEQLTEQELKEYSPM